MSRASAATSRFSICCSSGRARSIDCWTHCGAAMMHARTRSLLQNPQLVARAPERALRQVADAARNNNLAAVGAMLRRKFPVTARSQHGATPLHWAVFHGNAAMVEDVLRYNPPIDAQDRQFHGNPMGWLIHGALNPWGSSTGRHGECAPLLLRAGARVDEASLPTGHDALDRALREHFAGSLG